MKNILIIEDDSTLIRGLCKVLSSNEYDTTGCHCLKEARNLLQSHYYALVILDVTLPDSSGFDFLREIKRIFLFRSFF